MELNSNQALENIVNVDPELKRLWDEMIIEDYGTVEAYSEDKEDSVDVITIIDYILYCVGSDKTDKLEEIFLEIEKALTDGDEYTSELIAVAFLEGLQNAGRIQEIDYHNVFHQWFQPQTKRIYNGLILIWEGRKGLEAVEEENMTPELLEGEN